VQGRAIVPAALLLAVAGGIPAVHADAPEPEAVTITATRMAANPFNIPAAISAVSGDQLTHDALGVNLSDDIQMLPGLLARNRNNYAQDQQVSIRGFGASSTFGVRGIRIYQDGIPFSGPDGQGQVSQFNLESADRVEVLRGPFSALYGNSSGGVIQLFTARGAGPAQVHSAFAYGSYGTFRAGAGVTGGDGPWGYNLDFTHFQVDGYRPHSSAQSESFNGRVDYQISDASHLMVVGNVISRPGAQDPLGLTLQEFAADPYSTDPAASQFNTRKGLQQQEGGVGYDLKMTDAQTVTVMAYGGHRTVQQFLAIPASAQSALGSAGGVIDLDRTFGGADARWTLDTRLLGRHFTWVVGMTYDYQDELRRGYNNFIGSTAAPQYGVVGNLRRDEDDIASDFDEYAQGSWDFAERWSLMAGVRHSSVRFDFQDHFITATNGDDSGARRYEATTPVAGLIYKANDWLHLYTSYGQGFQTPIAAELAYRSDGAAGLNLGLMAERNRSVDVGAKIDMGPGLHAEVALFQALTSNEIVVDTNLGGRTTYQNAPRSGRSGVELSLDERINADWQVQLAYTYLDATYRDEYRTCVAAPCRTPQAPVLAGNRLPGVPRSDLYGAVRYGRETGWRVSATSQYISSVAVNDTNCTGGANGTPLCTATSPLQTLAPAYAVFGLEGGYGVDLRRAHLDGFVRVNNLADRHYVGSVIVDDANRRFFEPGPGFSVLVGVGASFR
jgi:iron complex outermembrane receptor protein